MIEETKFEGICIDRVLPLALLDEAERVAVAENLDNGVDEAADAQRIAFVRRRRWAPGRRLKIRFLDGTVTMRKKVREVAEEWTKYANIGFDFGDHAHADTDIRISFYADRGSWSAVGTEARIRSWFPIYQPTMNFGWLRDGSPQEEWSRVVLHEFGHALGAIHEHQTSIGGLVWNEPKVLEYFKGPPNFWDEETIRFNVLDKYKQSQLMGTTFDGASIMLYGFPGSLFKNGVGTKSNNTLSKQDKDFAAKAYPR